MKKKLYGVMVAALLLLSTGCGSKTPEEIIKQAADNMDKLENYNMKIVMEMSMSTEGQAMDLNMNIDSDIDEKNKTAKMKMGIDFAGFNVTADSYVVSKDGKTTTYTKDMTTDQWTKEIEEEEETETSSDISNILKDGKNIEEVKTEEENTKKYIITIKKEDSQKLFGSMGSTGEDLAGEDLPINGDVKLEVTIDTKNNYVKSMKMDMKDVMEEVEDVTYDKMLMTFEFSKFNEVGEVKVPEAIINNAVESTEE